MPSEGRPEVRFRVDQAVADAWRTLADAEGGASELVAAIVRAAQLADLDGFRDWLLGCAQAAHDCDGEQADDDEAADPGDTQAAVDAAYQQGFRAGQEQQLATAVRQVDAEWERLREERRAFEVEKVEATAAWNEWAEGQNRIRAEAEEMLRESGRRDLLGALRQYGLYDHITRPLAAAIEERAVALWQAWIRNAVRAPDHLLFEAAAEFAQAASTRQNDVMRFVHFLSPDGTRTRSAEKVRDLRPAGLAAILRDLAATAAEGHHASVDAILPAEPGSLPAIPRAPADAFLRHRQGAVVALPARASLVR